MSPFAKLIILDNTCINIFYLASKLEKMLTLWPFHVFVIPGRVVNEAKAWPIHGDNVIRILMKLREQKMIDIVSINEESESETEAYKQLRLAGPFLGAGESECMAIACCRDFIVASDDGIARKRCKEVLPSVETITTGQILNMALSDGLLTKVEVEQMWHLFKLKRDVP